MEYGDLVEFYKKKLLERYKQCRGRKHMGNQETIDQIREDLKQLTEEEKLALLVWLKTEFEKEKK